MATFSFVKGWPYKRGTTENHAVSLTIFIYIYPVRKICTAESKLKFINKIHNYRGQWKFSCIGHGL